MAVSERKRLLFSVMAATLLSILLALFFWSSENFVYDQFLFERTREIDKAISATAKSATRPLLIFGDSVAFASIDPAVLDSGERPWDISYNLAVPSPHIGITSNLIRRTNEKWNSLDVRTGGTVVVSFSFFIFKQPFIESAGAGTAIHAKLHVPAREIARRPLDAAATKLAVSTLGSGWFRRPFNLFFLFRSEMPFAGFRSWSKMQENMMFPWNSRELLLPAWNEERRGFTDMNRPASEAIYRKYETTTNQAHNRKFARAFWEHAMRQSTRPVDEERVSDFLQVLADGERARNATVIVINPIPPDFPLNASELEAISDLKKRFVDAGYPVLDYAIEKNNFSVDDFLDYAHLRTQVSVEWTRRLRADLIEKLTP